MPVVGTEKRNRLTEFEAVRHLRWWPQMYTQKSKEENAEELAWYGRWFHNDQSVLRGLCDFRACVSEKFFHSRDVVSQSLGYARGGVQRDESARRSVHSESLRCRL